MVSRSPSGELVWSTNVALPPMVLMPVSNASRVRRLAFSNISTICFASRAWRYSRGLRFTSWPSLRMARTSALDRSAIEHMSSPARRAAAARMSGSFSTGTAARSMIVVLLATICSFSSFRGGLRGACVFGKYLVKRSDRGIDVRALQNVGRQEPQDRIAGAIDNDAPLQHLCDGCLGELGGIEFRGQHQAFPAHIHNGVVLLRQLAQPDLKIIAHFRRVFEQASFLNLVD